MFLALYTAAVIISIGLMTALIILSMVRKSPQVILCTECQQCLAVCPMAVRGCNPMRIMVAAKCGGLDDVMTTGCGACVACGKCTKACPRGLSPAEEVEKWRARLSTAAGNNTGRPVHPTGETDLPLGAEK